MGLFSRWGRKTGGQSRSERKAATEALAVWAAARRGVEVYVEPRTAVTETTVVLVAHDGEFTRRRMASPEAAKDFAHEHALPIYDATVVGYPQRMRDYSRRQTILQQRAEREALGD